MELAERKAGRAKAQAAVLRLLSAVGEGSVSEVRALTGASRASIRPLIEDGVLSCYWQETFRRPDYRTGTVRSKLPVLTEEQRRAFDGLERMSRSGEACGALLYGVTGSGKTSVYIHLIASVLARGKAVLLLVPAGSYAQSWAQNNGVPYLTAAD